MRGECDHDRADRVADKASANYCTYFRPARGMHRSDAGERRDRARGELTELFGLADAKGPQPLAARDPVKTAEEARRELDLLFGIEPESEPDAGDPGDPKDPGS